MEACDGVILVWQCTWREDQKYIACCNPYSHDFKAYLTPYAFCEVSISFKIMQIRSFRTCTYHGIEYKEHFKCKFTQKC